MQDEEIYDWLRLLWTPHLEFEVALRLLETVGLPEEIFAMSYRELREIVSDDLALILSRSAAAVLHNRIESTIQWLKNTPQAELITLIDARFPKSMLRSGTPVIAFFALGDLRLLNQPTVIFLGSNQLTQTGEDIARQWSVDLSKRSVSVVAGAEDGPQRETLRAVAQHAGGKMIYLPVSALTNKEAEPSIRYMSEHGLVLSLLGPYGEETLDEQACLQSRMMLAVCEGFIVIEASLVSPALKVAKEALDLHRTVMAIPGSIYSPLSKGPHKLIKDGARLVETTIEVCSELDQWKN